MERRGFGPSSLRPQPNQKGQAEGERQLALVRPRVAKRRRGQSSELGRLCGSSLSAISDARAREARSAQALEAEGHHGVSSVVRILDAVDPLVEVSATTNLDAVLRKVQRGEDPSWLELKSVFGQNEPEEGACRSARSLRLSRRRPVSCSRAALNAAAAAALTLLLDLLSDAPSTPSRGLRDFATPPGIDPPFATPRRGSKSGLQLQAQAPGLPPRALACPGPGSECCVHPQAAERVVRWRRHVEVCECVREQGVDLGVVHGRALSLPPGAA
jgi:hypothetical protein